MKPGVEVIDDGGPDFSAPTYDAGDKAQVDQRKRIAGRIAKDKTELLNQLISTKLGRAWFWELLEFAGIMKASYTIPGDPYTTLFNEGQRNVGLKIMSDLIKASPENYVLMVSENKS